MRRDLDRLQDVLEAVQAIKRYTAAGRERFDSDELVRVWCLRHVEIIGEAVARLSEDIRSRYPDPPWRDIRRCATRWCTATSMWTGISCGWSARAPYRPMRTSSRLTMVAKRRMPSSICSGLTML